MNIVIYLKLLLKLKIFEVYFAHKKILLILILITLIKLNLGK